MAVSAFTIDRRCPAPIISDASGHAVFSVDCSKADVVYRLCARIYCVVASASHLATGGVFNAEYIVTNKNGTVAAVAAIGSSNNPANAATTTFVASHAQAADSNFAGTTCVWSVSGTNAVLTVTVQTGVPVAQSGVAVFLDCDVCYCGAT